MPNFHLDPDPAIPEVDPILDQGWINPTLIQKVLQKFFELQTLIRVIHLLPTSGNKKMATPGQAGSGSGSPWITRIRVCELYKELDRALCLQNWQVDHPDQGFCITFHGIWFGLPWSGSRVCHKGRRVMVTGAALAVNDVVTIFSGK